jgi:hypothetical protein
MSIEGRGHVRPRRRQLPGVPCFEVPSVNGYGTARGIAGFYAGPATGGEVGGVRLLQAGTVDKALRRQAAGHDLVLESDVTPVPGPQAGPEDGPFRLRGIGGFSGFGLRRPRVSLGSGYVTCALGGFDRKQAWEDAPETLLRDSKHGRTTLAP